MESSQPFSPSSKSTAAKAGLEQPRPEPVNQKSTSFAGQVTPQQPAPLPANPEGFIGRLEVFIHQARDIHNICIYHKQDVYAKICLTSHPETTVSTKIINGGGRNPVFNENLQLSVRTIESSLKCEVWMLSRVKNYLEDQLLGFALVPLSEVVIANGKLEKEFSLSSTDLFHSPAGFVQLSLSYIGSSPEVMAIPAPTASAIPDVSLPDSEKDDAIPCEYEKIEFPDLKIVNENQLMVSEYFGIQCTNLDAQTSESLVTSENGNCPDGDAGVHVVESFSTDNSLDSAGALKNDTPVSSVSTTESPVVLPTSSQSVSDPSAATSSLSQKEKSAEVTEGEADSSSGGQSDSAFVKPIISINVEPEQTVDQKDIVDLYMKSMQQFTESLAKMKLPMDIESSSPTTENVNAGSEKNLPAAKGTGPRVFYGSRAFF
ncbi:Phospholipase D beta 1 [Cocos nucifera]|nr:Phospholipase D beta 1 [Cocos nucifera]